MRIAVALAKACLLLVGVSRADAVPAQVNQESVGGGVDGYEFDEAAHAARAMRASPRAVHYLHPVEVAGIQVCRDLSSSEVSGSSKWHIIEIESATLRTGAAYSEGALERCPRSSTTAVYPVP